MRLHRKIFAKIHVYFHCSTESKIKVKPLLHGWVELTNLNGFAIYKDNEDKIVTLRNEEI